MNESDSIYQAPASDPSVAPAGDYMAAFVGPRFAEFYAPVFERFEHGGSASWHWPAFFVTGFWLLYRKMWAMTLVYWFVFPLLLAAIAVGISTLWSTNKFRAVHVFNAVYYGLYFLVSLIVVPIFANRIYYRHAKKKVARVQARSSGDQVVLDIARAGGTSGLAVVIIVVLVAISFIGIIAAISIPAYQDYTIRAQVSEGLSLSAGAKAAVAEHIWDTGDVPADNLTAGLAPPNQITGSYVASVAIDNGEVVVTYGRNANQNLASRMLILSPELTDAPTSSVSWTCWSDSIPAKWLPAACR